MTFTYFRHILWSRHAVEILLYVSLQSTGFKVISFYGQDTQKIFLPSVIYHIQILQLTFNWSISIVL